MAVFILVHGAWHDGACWDLLEPELRARGHETVAPTLALDDPAAGWADHAELVARWAPQGSRPVVVAHSWAGRLLPLVAQRLRSRLLVYLCARVAATAPDEPESMLAGSFDGTHLDELGRRVVHDPSAMYARVPADVARRFAASLRPQVFPDPVELDVRTHPSAYVLARDDEFWSLAWSRWAALEALGVEPVELDGGHFPMLERPAELADVLCRLLDA